MATPSTLDGLGSGTCIGFYLAGVSPGDCGFVDHIADLAANTRHHLASPSYLQGQAIATIGGKVSFKIARNFSPILVFTLQLKGGLNQVTFLFLFLLLPVPCLAFGSKVNSCSYSLASRAAWYGVLASLNMSSFAEILESLFSMFLGKFLRIDLG